MVNMAAGRRCFSERLWQNYGCYCGVGSRCEQAVDCLDSCCSAHDRCYGEMHTTGMASLLLDYKFTKNGTDIVCNDCPGENESGDGTEMRMANHSGDEGVEMRAGRDRGCSKCLCDRGLSLCLRDKPCPPQKNGKHLETCDPPSP